MFLIIMIYISLLIAFQGTAYAGNGPFDPADLDRYVTFYSSECFNTLSIATKLTDKATIALIPKIQIVLYTHKHASSRMYPRAQSTFNDARGRICKTR
jgi:hypothetical protein